jgi:hypothetical protein
MNVESNFHIFFHIIPTPAAAAAAAVALTTMAMPASKG